MAKVLNEDGDTDGPMPTFGKGGKMTKSNKKLKKKLGPQLKSQVAAKLKAMLINR
jgi:hypothetical protein